MDEGLDKSIKKVLSNTKFILAEQQKYLGESGENFNIFSITKIERYENNTHSAMIAELLNPRGSHHQGKLFLNEFLNINSQKCFKTLDKKEQQFKINSFIDQNISVNTEKHIGQINTTENQGGRIDIIISSSNCCFIIENKIDAIDQKCQLERYNNYPQEEKYILYLTLWGKDAPTSSAGNLEANKDYFPIAYKNEIVEWLENCIQKCKNDHVKHVIKQYLNLVKKITHQLKNKYMVDLNALLADNLLEAELISNNFDSVKRKLQKNFRDDLYKRLKEELSDLFTIEKHGKITDKEASIYLYCKSEKTRTLSFGISSFNGGTIYYGIYNEIGKEEIAKQVNLVYGNDNISTKHFPICYYLKTSENNHLNLNSTGILAQFNNDNYRNSLLNTVTAQIKIMVENHLDLVLKINNAE